MFLLETTSRQRLEPRKELDGSLAESNGGQAFRFFDLPFELRSKILEIALVTDEVYCLDPRNFLAGSRRLNIFLTSRQMHEDAYRVFYGGHTFRIFPTHGRFFGSKIVPLIARLPPRYREALTSLELRLGPGWTAPPKSWSVDGRLGLEQMRRVRVLKIFVECDPSLEMFQGFRVNETFYTEFSQHLLEGILQRLPAVSTVEIDSWLSAPSRGHLTKAIANVAKGAGVTAILWNRMDFPRKQEICKATKNVLPYMDADIAVN